MQSLLQSERHQLKGAVCQLPRLDRLLGQRPLLLEASRVVAVLALAGLGALHPLLVAVAVVLVTLCLLALAALPPPSLFQALFFLHLLRIVPALFRFNAVLIRPLCHLLIERFRRNGLLEFGLPPRLQPEPGHFAAPFLVLCRQLALVQQTADPGLPTAPAALLRAVAALKQLALTLTQTDSSLEALADMVLLNVELHVVERIALTRHLRRLEQDDLLAPRPEILVERLVVRPVFRATLQLHLYQMSRSVEETFQKKTPLQHILLRPDTYVGSTERTQAHLWLASPEGVFSKAEGEYVPALYKIFDQVLVNAADNYQRDKAMNILAVVIDQQQGSIQVTNNGKGIPVVLHKDYQVFVPQLVFGHLLTGSNYNDGDKKVVGGRNGYGAKLANIFSSRFQLEAADGTAGKRFYMVWTKNMSTHGAAEVSNYSGKDFVKVRFYPDLKLFKMDRLDEFTVGLFRRRVFDMAGIFGTAVKVSFNGQPLKVKNFQEYAKLYLKDDSVLIADKESDSERWTVLLGFSEGQFQQVSFVNAINTSRGGTHISHICDQLVTRIQQAVTKKNKDLTVKPFQIKQHLWLFVRCLVQNPAFDSQTKQTLVTKPSQFGSLPTLSEKVIKAVLKSGIIDRVINEAKARQLNKMSRATAGGKKAKITGIPKLDDANQAGSKNSQKCVLILTEGDSAKALAVSGLQVVGRDYFGVFPLKGKLLNVRQASPKQVLQNSQIQSIIKIMGLQVGKVYQDLKSLRYGAIMIMTDQDTDGSHIKGLIINLVHSFWPSLLRIDGFLLQFITPILKASGPSTHSFYSAQDFHKWAEGQDLKLWKVKYYKGLGTSTDKQAQEYFKAIESNRLKFLHEGAEDDEAIDLVFNRKRAEDRKRWLQTYDKTRALDFNIKVVKIKKFVDDELIHFSIADNMRSIPSLVDGLKPGQRKILYACFKRNLKAEIKVAQLSGYVAEHSAYHHGEMSLAETIVGMAQDFVGSNNINLLQPIGQFGSRNQGGKEHASPRYIFTNLSRVTRLIFIPEDDNCLQYLEDDGQAVEPLWYAPVLPLVLVNGAEGIGSGWSTSIPCYSPRDLAQWLLNRMEGRPNQPLRPWFKGFQGNITPDQKGGFLCSGICTPKEQEKLDITQLPVRKWTKDYRLFLDRLSEQQDAPVVDVRQLHTKNRVHFEVQLAEGTLQRWGHDLHKHLKLNCSIPTTNFVLFDKNGILRRYPGPESILQQYFGVRIQLYAKRKAYLLSKIGRELQILENRSRFIKQVVEQTLSIRNVRRKQLCKTLLERGYTRYSRLQKVNSRAKQVDQEEEAETAEQQLPAKQFDYLLKLPLWSLTEEQIQKLLAQRAAKESERDSIAKTSLESMWKTDIQRLLEVLTEVEEQEEQERLSALGKAEQAKKKRKRKPQKKEGGGREKDKPTAQSAQHLIQTVKSKKRMLEDEPQAQPSPSQAEPDRPLFSRVR